MLIMLAGIVSTYFQFASHSMCMKNRITSIALAHETAIIMAHIVPGDLWRSDSLLPTANETAVSTQEGDEHGDVFADAGVAVLVIVPLSASYAVAGICVDRRDDVLPA